MMQVNIQHVFEQKANFDHCNEIKTLISSIIPMILNIYQVKKQLCVNSTECLNSNKYGIYFSKWKVMDFGSESIQHYLSLTHDNRRDINRFVSFQFYNNKKLRILYLNVPVLFQAAILDKQLYHNRQGKF